MKWVLDIIGVIFILFGGVWILQGLNILQVGFMAGHLQYALLGLVAAIIGIALIAFANMRSKGTPTTRGSGSGS